MAEEGDAARAALVAGALLVAAVPVGDGGEVNDPGCCDERAPEHPLTASSNAFDSRSKLATDSIRCTGLVDRADPGVGDVGRLPVRLVLDVGVIEVVGFFPLVERPARIRWTSY